MLWVAIDGLCFKIPISSTVDDERMEAHHKDRPNPKLPQLLCEMVEN
jgi:hypothetical protein